MGNRFKRMGKLNVVMGKLKAIGRNLSIKLKVGGKVNFRRGNKPMANQVAERGSREYDVIPNFGSFLRLASLDMQQTSLNFLGT